MEPLDILKQLYKDNFGIVEDLVELMANRDILHLTATGSSIDSTSRFLNIDTNEIVETNKKFYGFDGWTTDMDLNPFVIYKSLIRAGYWDYETFYHEISTLSPYFNEVMIKLMFDVVCKFSTIEELIDKEWR